jgi:hypothetical protein
MQPELIADRSLPLPIGVVRLTIARHVDGHYSGVATLRRTGRRLGLLVSERPAAGGARVRCARVDPCAADAELLAALTAFFRETALADAASRDALSGDDGGSACAAERQAMDQAVTRRGPPV